MFTLIILAGQCLLQRHFIRVPFLAHLLIAKNGTPGLFKLILPFVFLFFSRTKQFFSIEPSWQWSYSWKQWTLLKSKSAGIPSPSVCWEVIFVRVTQISRQRRLHHLMPHLFSLLSNYTEECALLRPWNWNTFVRMWKILVILQKIVITPSQTKEFSWSSAHFGTVQFGLGSFSTVDSLARRGSLFRARLRCTD